MKKISANIKFLRKKHNLTQQEFADALGIKRSMIGAYEEERASPKMENLKAMASYFGVTVDELVSEKITDKYLEDRSKRVEKENELKAGNLRILSITVDAEDRENIELVPVKASAGYVNGYSDPEFVKELPKFHLPMLQGGTFRAFEIKGDSMLPIYPGSIIVGEYVDDWKGLKNNDTYIIISRNDGIVYKRVVLKSKEFKSITLKSDNKAYEPYAMELEEILEIWKAKAFISTHLPEPEQEMSMNQLSSLMLEMQKKLNKLN
jgi:transcriptional regulator with XRE-family HTH domain